MPPNNQGRVVFSIKPSLPRTELCSVYNSGLSRGYKGKCPLGKWPNPYLWETPTEKWCQYMSQRRDDESQTQMQFYKMINRALLLTLQWWKPNLAALTPTKQHELHVSLECFRSCRWWTAYAAWVLYPNGRIHFSRIIAKEFVETSKYPKVIDEKFYRLLAAWEVEGRGA